MMFFDTYIYLTMNIDTSIYIPRLPLESAWKDWIIFSIYWDIAIFKVFYNVSGKPLLMEIEYPEHLILFIILEKLFL